MKPLVGLANYVAGVDLPLQSVAYGGAKDSKSDNLLYYQVIHDHLILQSEVTLRRSVPHLGPD